MQDLFELFIREKNYLEGRAPRTLDYYRTCWSAFNHYEGEVSEQGLKNWVINMREAEVSPGAVSCFARGINSFLPWLKENGQEMRAILHRYLLTHNFELVFSSKDELSLTYIVFHKIDREMAVLSMLITVPAHNRKVRSLPPVPLTVKT